MDSYEDDDFKDFDLESEPEDSSSPIEYKPSYVLIVIDTDESMFATNGTSNCSAFMNCLNVCSNVANSLVLIDKRSLKGPLGVILATNEVSKANLIEFENPIPETITFLNDLKKETNDNLKLKYLRKGDFDLGDFFLFCKNKLVEVNADVYKRTVLYITNNDDPMGNDAKKKFKVIHESRKFSSAKMNLVVVTFNTDFNSKTVYSEILETCSKSTVELVDSTNLTEKINDLIKKRYLKYSSKFYPFIGDYNRHLQVVLSKFVSSTRISKNMFVTRDTEKEVKRYMKPNMAGTSKCLYSKTEPPLIIGTSDKEKFTETNIPIGFTLLCVIKETSKIGWIIESPSLMEKHNQEIQPIFEIFWQFCIEKSRCLLCYRKFKKCGDVRLVELVPKFINHSKVFLVRVLPFASEIYYPFISVTNNHVQEENKAMNLLIEALTFDFKPETFNDPVESKKKAYIKASLLNQPIEPVTDGIPLDQTIDKLITEQIKELENLDLLDSLPSNKRVAAKTEVVKQKRMRTK